MRIIYHCVMLLGVLATWLAHSGGQNDDSDSHASADGLEPSPDFAAAACAHSIPSIQSSTLLDPTIDESSVAVRGESIAPDLSADACAQSLSDVSNQSPSCLDSTDKEAAVAARGDSVAAVCARLPSNLSQAVTGATTEADGLNTSQPVLEDTAADAGAISNGKDWTSGSLGIQRGNSSAASDADRKPTGAGDNTEAVSDPKGGLVVLDAFTSQLIVTSSLRSPLSKRILSFDTACWW